MGSAFLKRKMKLFYLFSAVTGHGTVTTFLPDLQTNITEFIDQSTILKKKFARFAKFYANEGKIGKKLAPRLITKYNKMIGQTVGKLEGLECDRFPVPKWWAATLQGVIPEDDPFWDLDIAEKLNREDPCKASNRLEKITFGWLRDSIRDCDTGEIDLATFLRRQQKYRMIFAKTRNVLDCEFDHRSDKRGSFFWFDKNSYFDKFGSSYNSGEKKCASIGMRLCTFEEYCPNGEFGETMKGFGLDWYQDSWSPFYDPNSLNQRSNNVNNWLQVGFWKHVHVLGTDSEKYYNKQYWVNPWGKPWGLTNDGMVMKHGICCATDGWY